ncbi:MAG: DNA polymerase IV [Gammaproteobacteria bacterium]|nr:DNA polymerase IV [Gammaproteobacteria bacterium]
MIIHADMDAFYASVEIRDRPELADKPVAVGGSVEGRGVISAANYVARRYGVHSALPTVTAKRLCPDLILLPGRMGFYAEISQHIRRIFERFTPLIEPLSLDEAFLDVTHSEKLFGPAQNIGQQIKHAVKAELDLVVSVGIAPNKFIAKIASDIDKPDGFVFVSQDQIQAFLDPLPVKRIWGVGKTTEKQLQQLGIHSVRDLRLQAKENLLQRFGEHGAHLWELAHGIDHRPVVSEYDAKSISHEITFPKNITDRDILLSVLLQLTEQVGTRLRQQEYAGRTVHLKIRYADFTTLTRSHTMDHASHVTSELWQTVKTLFTSKLPAKLPPVRLLGMGVSGFDRQDSEYALQQDLFVPDGLKAKQKAKQIDKVSDAVKERFGAKALRRGRVVK